MLGAKLAGGNPANGRIENDFYATDPRAVEMLLLERHDFNLRDVLEPCVGSGTIADAIKKFSYGYARVTGIDIVDRGYPDTIVADFLSWKTEKQFDTIITNPPYSLASEFIERCLDLLKIDGQMAMFLKIQFLEGQKRKEMYTKHPPKYIYVFRNRMPTWGGGQQFNPATGKRWATTFCNAWYVWQKGNHTEPVVRWL